MTRSFVQKIVLGLFLLGAGVGAGCAHFSKPQEPSRDPASFSNAATVPAAHSGYVTNGLCGGYPRLAHLKTPPGFCVGQVATGFRMPRGVLEFDPTNFPNQFLVTDMGSWEPHTGILWLVRPGKQAGAQVTEQFEMIKLLTKLDLPHAVVLGPEKKGEKRAWVATASQILRVNVTGLDTATPVATSEVVIDGLPGVAPPGQNYRHPLKTIVFNRKGELYINVGSHSNNCEGENIAKNMTGPSPVLCREADGPNPNGSIRKYVFDFTATPPKVVSSSVVARGLRNSVALTTYARNGLVLQAENGRDAINKADPTLSDDTLPHEEINVISEGKHYGWPYCYDDGKLSPEFRHYPTRSACASREQPALLLPAHAAPLGMVYYRRSLFPDWYRNQLLVSLHGYRAAGHRIVAYRTREDGVPFGESYDVVSGWESGPSGPMGAPVSITLAADGSVYIVEDKNRTLLKLFYDPAGGDGIPSPSPKVFNPGTGDGESTETIAERCQQLNLKKTTWARVEREVIDVSCVNCHRSGDLHFKICDDVGNAKMLRGDAGGRVYVLPHDAASSPFYQRMISAGAPMPPYPSKEEKAKLLGILPTIRSWIDSGANETQ